MSRFNCYSADPLPFSTSFEGTRVPASCRLVDQSDRSHQTTTNNKHDPPAEPAPLSKLNPCCKRCHAEIPHLLSATSYSRMQYPRPASPTPPTPPTLDSFRSFLVQSDLSSSRLSDGRLSCSCKKCHADRVPADQNEDPSEGGCWKDILEEYECDICFDVLVGVHVLGASDACVLRVASRRHAAKCQVLNVWGRFVRHWKLGC